MEKSRKILQGAMFCNDPYAVCSGSECLIIVTEWDEFKELDFVRIKKLLRRPLIIDGRNVYETEVMQKLGFTYVAMGRKKTFRK